MGNKSLILCYTDNAILIAEEEDDLQRMLHSLMNTAKKYNIKISTKSIVKNGNVAS